VARIPLVIHDKKIHLALLRKVNMSRFDPGYIGALALIIVGLVLIVLRRPGVTGNINFALLNRNNRQSIKQVAPRERRSNGALGTVLLVAGVLVALAQLLYDIFRHGST
jgi:hypothetical protein